MQVTKRIDIELLGEELSAASVPHRGVGHSGPEGAGEIYTFDPDGAVIDLPPEAVPVVDAHVAPPRVWEYAQQDTVEAKVRTTTAIVMEVFRFPCAEKHLYRANLRISGVDIAPGMTSLVQEGRFVWKRETANAILVGITVVSQIPTTMPTGWATNCFAQGTDIVFTVKGPAATIDWLLVGEVGRFAPEGLEA